MIDKDWRREQRASERRFTLLREIATHWRQNHYGPSVRVLASRIGRKSPSQVSQDMHALREQGLVKLDPGISCSVQPTERGWTESGVEPGCFSTR